MKKTRTSVVFEYRLISTFENLRRRLLSEKLADRLDKPLAYWVLPNDRRLPLAFMGRSLRELLDTPFDDLCSTPGIGQKKIGTLLDLLSRAAQPQTPSMILPWPVEVVESSAAVVNVATAGGSTNGTIDPALVCEATWTNWRENIVQQKLGREPLGRFAASLQSLPRVTWTTPLDAYTALTLEEIRALKTHGEKRVRAVLGVFSTLYSLRPAEGTPSHLALQVVPEFAVSLESWIQKKLSASQAPAVEELRQSLVDPLLAQIKLDGGEQVASLIEHRLGLRGPSVSVRQAARQLNLTRARVYQLLYDVDTIMNIRWPAGRAWTAALRSHWQAEWTVSEPQHETNKPTAEWQLFESTSQICFPNRQQASTNGVAGHTPLEFDDERGQ